MNVFLNVAKTYLALGLNSEKNIIFVQSDVKEHAELSWILNTLAKTGEMERMTQYKDKSTRHKDNINLGLFAYPVLMASDILLYDTNLVPVGEDQKQHVELTRDLAQKFNKLYGETFVVPEPLIKKQGARIMGLDDPGKKMSKSASSSSNYIAFSDNPAVAEKKIMKAVTDSGSEVKSGADKPALSNLLSIYSLFTNRTIKDIEKEYTGQGYGAFKKGLAEIVGEFLFDFQKKIETFEDNEVKKILTQGADRARELATKKMELVKQKIGLNY